MALALSSTWRDRRIFSPVSPTGRFLDRRGSSSSLIEFVVSGISVGLHDPAVTSEMPSRIFASARARVGEDRRQRNLAAKRPVVADRGPYPAGDRLQSCQNRHGRVVGMDALAPEHLGPDTLNDQIEGRDACATLR
jgi:hypothetical protein